MKNVLKVIIKIAVSGLITFFILNIFCLIYFDKPGLVVNNTKATSYKWQRNQRFSVMTEGFGYGMINDDGCNNLLNLSDIDKIDVLVMGSSHMDAIQVNQYQNMVSILNKLFKGRCFTYNIAQSGHDFIHCVQDIISALDVYKPTQYAIIETDNITFTKRELEKALMGHEEMKINSSEFVRILKLVPYFRLLADQYVGMNISSKDIEKEIISTDEYRTLIDDALEHVSDTCKEHNVRPIILYHEQLFTDKEGKAYTKTNPEILEAFSMLCEKNEIVFVNLTDTFIENYEKNHVFPHGFENTVPGAGHLNKYGHEMAANKLYEVIMELEAESNGI